MGSTATVIVAGSRSLLAGAARRLADLEAKWSRFLPHSEVTRLNESRSVAVKVSADTRLLVERALTAWSATGGAFDPSILDAIVGWGYDRPFDEIDVRTPSVPTRTPGADRVAVDHAAGTVHLGGAGFDPGGIGKGLAADIVAGELVDAGATAALVNVGGDLRITGRAAGRRVGRRDRGPGRGRTGICDAWPWPAAPSRRAALGGADGSWTTAVHAHHLIDPATGAPADPALAGVSVLAGRGVVGRSPHESCSRRRPAGRRAHGTGGLRHRARP